MDFLINFQRALFVILGSFFEGFWEAFGSFFVNFLEKTILLKFVSRLRGRHVFEGLGLHKSIKQRSKIKLVFEGVSEMIF